MKQLINKHHLLILLVIPGIWLSMASCAGSSGKSINIGPVPHANGLPGNGDSTQGNDGSRRPQNQPDPFATDNRPGAAPAGSGAKPDDSSSSPSASPSASSSVAVMPVVAAPSPPAAPLVAAAVPPAAAPATPPPVSASAPANCTGYYALGYGDPYQSNGTGAWLAKNKDDFTEPCTINAPTCTGAGDMGFGTKWARGKLWLAKLTDANKGMEDVCIITKLTGTNG